MTNKELMKEEEKGLMQSEKWVRWLAITAGVIGFGALIGSFFLFANKQTLWETGLPIKTELFDHLGSFISGVVGSLFTLASVLLFYLALSLQRTELSLTREELSGQRKELERQNLIATLQQFENKFFNLLNLHVQLKQNIDEQMKGHSGKTYFEYLTQIIKDDSNSSEGFDPNNIKLTTKPKVILIELYDEVFVEHSSLLGHYFRNLFHIVKFIEESIEINNSFKSSDERYDEKYKFIRILRSTLSTPEINLLAYNGLTTYGAAFKPYIEKYKLLKNMDFASSVVGIEEVLLDEYPHLRKEYKK